MMIEAGYRSEKKNTGKDEDGEYEEIEWENFEGKIEKIKKYKDPSVI